MDHDRSRPGIRITGPKGGRGNAWKTQDIRPSPGEGGRQAIIAKRSEKLSDDQMLKALSQIFAQRGFLSGLIIDEAEDCPSSSAFRSRFGSLLRAYTLVGFAPDRDYRYLEINRRLRAIHPDIVTGIIAGIEKAGGTVARDPETELLRVNGEFSVSITIARCFQTGAGSNRWKLRLDEKLSPDITVAVRMGADNEIAKDYYLLPALDMREATLRLTCALVWAHWTNGRRPLGSCDQPVTKGQCLTL